MADKSAIEWTDATWNPVAGCTIVSPGCANCYAMKMAARLEAMGQPIYAGMTKKVNGNVVWTGKVEQSNWGQVIKPLSWKRPRRVFVNSMSDLFHEAVPDSVIDTVFAIMALCPQHTFQVLTKRAERMRDYLGGGKRQYRDVHPQEDREIAIDKAMNEIAPAHCCKRELHDYAPDGLPLHNVWLGVSAERQQEADERVPHLLHTPAARRFVSAEPLLGPIDFNAAVQPAMLALTGQFKPPPSIDWVIVGGESGRNARPMLPDWARSLRDQCSAAGVAFFFKQFGEWLPWSHFNDAGIVDHPEQTRYQTMEWENASWRDVGFPMWCDGTDGNIDAEFCVGRVGKKAAGRLLDGKEHNEFPNPAPSPSVSKSQSTQMLSGSLGTKGEGVGAGGSLRGGRK